METNSFAYGNLNETHFRIKDIFCSSYPASKVKHTLFYFTCYFSLLNYTNTLSVILSHTHTLLQDMHIISTDEKQVFAAVQEWNQNNTYSLYISDSPGVFFTLSLENLRTSRGPAGNLLVDFYKVCSRSCSLSESRAAHPPIPNTRSSCRETFIRSQLCSVSLHQKGETIFSPLIISGAFIFYCLSVAIKPVRLWFNVLLFKLFKFYSDFTEIVRLFTKQLNFLINLFFFLFSPKKSENMSQ